MLKFIVNEDISLKKTNFNTANELVQYLLDELPSISLIEIDFEKLSTKSKKKIIQSQKLGLQNVINFQG